MEPYMLKGYPTLGTFEIYDIVISPCEKNSKNGLFEKLMLNFICRDCATVIINYGVNLNKRCTVLGMSDG